MSHIVDSRDQEALDAVDLELFDAVCFKFPNSAFYKAFLDISNQLGIDDGYGVTETCLTYIFPCDSFDKLNICLKSKEREIEKIKNTFLQKYTQYAKERILNKLNHYQYHNKGAYHARVTEINQLKQKLETNKLTPKQMISLESQAAKLSEEIEADVPKLLLQGSLFKNSSQSNQDKDTVHSQHGIRPKPGGVCN